MVYQLASSRSWAAYLDWSTRAGTRTGLQDLVTWPRVSNTRPSVSLIPSLWQNPVFDRTQSFFLVFDITTIYVYDIYNRYSYIWLMYYEAKNKLGRCPSLRQCTIPFYDFKIENNEKLNTFWFEVNCTDIYDKIFWKKSFFQKNLKVFFGTSTHDCFPMKWNVPTATINQLVDFFFPIYLLYTNTKIFKVQLLLGHLP